MAKKSTRSRSTTSKSTSSAKVEVVLEEVAPLTDEDAEIALNEELEDAIIEAYESDALAEEIDDEEDVVVEEKKSKSKSKKKSTKKDEEEVETPVDISELTVKDIPGVGPSIAKKLIESGFGNIRAIATLPPKQLQEDSGIGEKTALKIVLAAQELCNIDFVTADTVFERRQKLGRIVTGSNNLNELLGGGLESGAVTEFFGEFRTGKTQIAHQLCVNVQLPEDQGGLNGKALYVDTEGTFRPERLAQMAIARGMDVQKTLKNVVYARAYNCEHQINILKQARKIIEEQNIKLLIVDSVIGHFRSEFFGLGSLAPRQQLLNVHLHQIIQLAETYSLAALVTNQVQSKPDVFFGNPTRAAGGNILGHASTYRIYLRKGKGDTRVAKMIDAPGLPESEAAFSIGENGISDVEE
ncbi:MAG: DNA repair and recombination protein RadA [Candidatus Hodarchaeota archaeon]